MKITFTVEIPDDVKLDKNAIKVNVKYGDIPEKRIRLLNKIEGFDFRKHTIKTNIRRKNPYDWRK